MACSSTPVTSPARFPAVDISNISQLNNDLTTESKIDKVYEILMEMRQEKSQKKGERTKIVVSKDCSYVVRSTYKALQQGNSDEENDENREKEWEYEESFASHHNKMVTDRLMKEVEANYQGKWTRHEIEAACRIYWRTLQNRYTRSKTPGKLEAHKKRVKRNQIMRRKLERRQSAVDLLKCTEQKKMRLKSVMKLEFMSSEESDEEDIKSRNAKSLPWESKKLQSYKVELDKAHVEHCKPNQLRAMSKINRPQGLISFRPIPPNTPKWAIASDESDNE